MVKKYVLALLLCLPLVGGCATLADLGKDVCDAALGGSSAGDLCNQIDKLIEQPEDEAPAGE